MLSIKIYNILFCKWFFNSTENNLKLEKKLIHKLYNNEIISTYDSDEFLSFRVYIT